MDRLLLERQYWLVTIITTERYTSATSQLVSNSFQEEGRFVKQEILT
jgi:hypothetical protein